MTGAQQLADLKDLNDRLKFAERELVRIHRLYVMETERSAKVREALNIIIEELDRDEESSLELQRIKRL